MPRKALVEIVGDASSLLRSMRQSIASVTGFRTSLKELGVDARKSADVQVAAAVKRDAKMREQIVALKQVASQAKKGSKEEVAATRLAGEAQAKLARSTAVTARESKALTLSAGRAGAAVGREARGALAGSGIFRSLGRSLAFASGGFLLFASGSALIRKAIGAARDAGVAMRQLRAQVKAGGDAWTEDLGRKVDASTTKLSDLSGFVKDQLVGSLALLTRATGNTSIGLKLNSVVADVARGRHISLTNAAVALGKAYNGQTTALRRLGVEVPKNLKGMAAINFVAAKFKGQAQAGATAADRFNVTLHNTEETIGNGILPVLNRYLGLFGRWLAGLNESGKLQRGVTATVHAFTGGITTAAGAVKKLYTIAAGIAGAVGGWKNALALAVGAWAGFKAAGIASSIAVEAANLAAALGVGSAWKAALISTGLGALAVAAGLAAAYVITHWSQVKGWFQTFWTYFKAVGDASLQALLQSVRAFVHTILEFATAGIRSLLKVASYLPFVGGKAKAALAKINGYIQSWSPDFSKVSNAFSDALAAGAAAGANRAVAEINRQIAGLPGKPKKLGVGPGMAPPEQSLGAAARAEGGGGTGSGSDPSHSNLLKKFALPFKLQLEQARAAITKTRADDFRVDREIVGFVNGLIREHRLKGQQLLDALNAEASATGDLYSEQQSAAKKTTDAAKKHAEAVKKMAEQTQQAIDNARQQIGELFQGPILAPTDAQTKAQLGVPAADPKMLTNDLRAQTKLFSGWQHDLATLAKRGAPTELLKELRGQGESSAPEVHALATASMTVLRQFFQAFAQREKQVRTAATVQLRTPKVVLTAQHVSIMSDVGSDVARHHAQQKLHVHVDVDGRELAHVVIPHSQRKAQTQVAQRGGRHAGTNVGLL